MAQTCLRDTILLFLVFCAGGDAQAESCYDPNGYMQDGYCDPEMNIQACTFDGGDCCPSTCVSGEYICGSNDFDCLDPNALIDTSNCGDIPHPPPLCSLDISRNWVIESTEQVLALAEAINCSGGYFNVEWRGTVAVEKTISVSYGTVLNVTGAGSSAVIDGRGMTNLFVVANASLHLNQVNVTNGTANHGGAITALAESHLSFDGSSFVGNVATYSGGALYVSNCSVLRVEGNSNFNNNHANFDGGAVSFGHSCSISWSGVTTFHANTALGAGGAVSIGSYTRCTWSEQTRFQGNVANYSGGAVAAFTGSIVTWAGETSFTGNIADWAGGALFLRDVDSVSWSGETIFSNNTAVRDTAGAVLIWVGGSVSWSGKTTFYGNIGHGWGGGAISVYPYTDLSWTGQTAFIGNAAYGTEGGGALLISQSTGVSWSGETLFQSNIASNQGGAIFIRFGSPVLWNGTTEFSENSANYGGALFVSSGSTVDWSGETHFRSNMAWLDGGAVASSIVPSWSTDGWGLSSHIAINALTTFVGNTCEGNGGAMAIMGSLQLLVNSTEVTYARNLAAVAGGAIFISGQSLGPVFNDAHFISNAAVRGGAVYSTGTGTVTANVAFSTTYIKCAFIGNNATATGGAMDTASGFDKFVDTSFLRNIAGAGGALNLAGAASFHNCSFDDNISDDQEGAAVSNVGYISNMTRCRFSDNIFNCKTSTYLDSEKGNSNDTVCSGCGNCVECSFEQSIPICTTAMEHSTSQGGTTTIESLQIDRGFWRATTTTTRILPCYNAAACAGGITDESTYCAQGYQGPYCSVCIDGYTANTLGFTCYECSFNKGGIIVAMVLAVVGMVIIVAILSHLVSPDMVITGRGLFGKVVRNLNFQRLKIIIIAWQILTQFSVVANVTFPGIYQRFLDGVNFLNFDFSWMLSVGCVVNIDTHVRLLIFTLTPIAVMSLLGATYAIGVKRSDGSADAIRHILHKHISMALFVTVLVYSSVSSTVFQMFSCDDLEDGNTYLRVDYRIHCDSPKHRALQIYSGFMIFLYPLGIPAIYGVLLYRTRHLLQTETSRAHSVRAQWTSELWSPYRPSRFYYEVIECGRRIMLTGALVFIYPNTAAQIAVALMVSFTFAIISEGLAPYKSIWDAWLSRAGHVVVFTSLFLALLLKVDISDEHARSQQMFEIVLVTVHGFMILAVFLEMLFTACRLPIEEQYRPQRRYRLGKTFPSRRIVSGTNEVTLYL